MLAGILLLLCDGLIQTIGVNIMHIPNPIPFDWGMICLELFGVFGLVARYGRTGREVKALSGRILGAHEEERKRLSREIHDGVGQSLQAIKLNSLMLEGKTGRGLPVEREDLRGLVSEISRSIEEQRSVAIELRPGFLEEGTLAEAFRWYGRKFSERTGMRLEIEGTGDVDAPLKVIMFAIQRTRGGLPGGKKRCCGISPMVLPQGRSPKSSASASTP